MAALAEGIPLEFTSAGEILDVVDPMVTELEAKLDAYENHEGGSF